MDSSRHAPETAIATWWRNANRGAREKARAADFYVDVPLSPDLIATLSRAGVDLVDAHLVAPAGGRRGYYLPRESSEAMRALQRADDR